MQRLCVNPTLEIDHFIDGPPKIDPTNSVKLRFVATIKPHRVITARESQYEPSLFLADAKRFAIAANIFARQLVSQPVARDGQHFDVALYETDIFVQFTKHCIDRFLAFDHPTLRKLPAFGPYPTTQQELIVRIRKDDTDARAKPFGVYPIVAHSNRT